MNEEINLSAVPYIIEFLGTFAFAVSGIRHAAAKHFDWFGGYVCGIAVAIGGGTIRDVMLDDRSDIYGLYGIGSVCGYCLFEAHGTVE